MIKIQLVITLIIMSCISSIGQKFSKKFGHVQEEELLMKQYSKDKGAEAIVLYDKAKSYFFRMENTFDVVFERKTRIKILTEAGTKWAEIEIPFYQEGKIYERIYDVKAYTYNLENGEIVKKKLDLSNTYTEKLNKYWKVKKIALPNVKVGSVIEYKYRINSQYLFNLRDWEFQWKIPVLYSEYEVKMIPFYEYTFLLQGANKFDSHLSYVDSGLERQFGSMTFQDVVNKFIMRNVPAFKSEDFITSINDYIIKLDFQLSKIIYPNGVTKDVMTTWEKLIKEFSKNKRFGKYVKKTKKRTSKVLGEKIKMLKTDIEKFDFVLDYVKSNYKWNGVNEKYASKSPKKLIKDKIGNSADINLFAIGLLNGVGIKAYPIILSTRENGKIKRKYPFSKFFNYVLIYVNVNGENILSDATEMYLLNNRIPPKCINDSGLIIDKEKVEWTSLKGNSPSEVSTKIKIEFDKDSLFKAYISKYSTEYDALYFRKHYFNNAELIRKELTSEKYTILDSSIIVLNQNSIKSPYILKYEIKSSPEIVNDKIYLSPFPNEAMTENPMKQKKRTYDVDLIYKKKRSFNSAIIIPDG